MIDLIRIVRRQQVFYSYEATQNRNHAVQLDLLLENKFSSWSWHIANSFKHPPPHPSARFRPPYGKNVFYGSLAQETALYEEAFHFMRQCIKLPVKTEEKGTRVLFSVEAQDHLSVDVRANTNYLAIMDKNDYSASHQFVQQNQKATFIWYPSCRDPQQRNNAAILEINHLAKRPKAEFQIHFLYDNKQQKLTWLDYDISIEWKDVV